MGNSFGRRDLIVCLKATPSQDKQKLVAHQIITGPPTTFEWLRTSSFKISNEKTGIWTFDIKTNRGKFVPP